MFEMLRSWIKPIIYITLVVFLGLIVLEWGMQIGGSGRYARSGGGIAGLVNGEEVTREGFNQVYNNLYNSRQAQSDQDLSEDQMAQLRKQTWNEVVSDLIMQQEFKKSNIVVTDQDIFNYVRFNPPQVLRDFEKFQTDGKFDYKKYLQAMADPSNAPLWAQVEKMVLPSVQVSKLQELVTGAARVTRQEVRDAFLRSAEKSDFAVISVPMSNFLGAVGEPTADELQKYYEENSQKFRTDERRVVEVALFSKEVTEHDWSLVQAQAKAIYDSLKSGADFATMARSRSNDGSASAGGDLGWLPISGLDTQYVAGALALAKDEISPPVRSSFGWHIIKMNGMRDANGKATADKAKAVEIHTSHIHLQVRASDETYAAARKKAREFRQAAVDDGFESAASKFGIEAKKTGAFQRGGSIEFIGPDQAASEFAFNHKKGEVSGVLENTSNCFVIRVDEIKPAGVMPLEEIHEAVVNLTRNEKAKQVALDSARALYAAVLGGADMETVARDHKALFQITGLIDRSASLPTTVGQDPMAIGAMFSLKQVGQISEPIIHERGAAFFKLLNYETLGVDQFQAAQDSISAQLLNSKQNNYWQRWYTARIKEAKTENFVEQEAAEQASLDDSVNY